MSDAGSNNLERAPLENLEGPFWEKNLAGLRPLMPETANRVERAWISGRLQFLVSEERIVGAEFDGAAVDPCFQPNSSPLMESFVRQSATKLDEGAEVLILCGVGPGEVPVLVGDLIKKADNAEWTGKVIGVEIHAELLAWGLALFDWMPALSSGAVELFTGEDWESQLTNWLKENDYADLPESKYCKRPGRPGLSQETLSLYGL